MGSADPLVLKPRIRYRAVGDDGVVVHLENGRVLVVNEVGLQIVDWLKEPVGREELVRRISEEFDVRPDQAASDLQSFLEQLEAEEVLETQQAKGCD